MRAGRTGKSSTRVRSKVVALLVSLAALWAFAAYVTLQDGTNLLTLNTLANRIALPGEEVTEALQAERLSSLLYIEDPSADRREQLASRRESTDAAARTLREGIADSTVRMLASDDLETKLADVTVQLDELSRMRSEIDSGTTSRATAVAAYTTAIEALLRVNNSVVVLDDDTIALLGRTLNKVTQTKEILRQEEALIAGALAAGELTPADRTAFTQLVGNQRFLLTEALAEFPYPEVTDKLQALLSGPQWRELTQLENSVMAGESLGALSLATWDGTISPVIEQVRAFLLDAKDVGLAKATPVAIGVIIRLILAGGLGLIAVIASIVISITTARQLVRQLERLRNAARDLAAYRLPRVVERLQHGESVDVKQEAPPLEFGSDEIGQVGEAFNQVQETAIRVAVEQAELRRSVRDVFLSLARRSQALLHRQLGLLDAMERRATDAEELAELFRVDHLATRMRRNAENLIVLSGATAGRAWRKPVPMVDVLRGALAEVEDYTRVTVQPVGNASLLGRAVGDVIHLLAELIENAVSFSPPQTTVRVGGSVVGYGFAIEIEDRGLGMSPEELAAANEQLRDPPEFRLTSTARLGLYVVAKLAERHGIRVRLTESAYGGTTAIVLLPGSIMADDGTAAGEPLDPSQLDSYRPAQLAGVGRHRLQTDVADRARAEAATALAVRGPQRDLVDADPVAAEPDPLQADPLEVETPVPVRNGTNGREPGPLAPVLKPASGGSAELPVATPPPAPPPATTTGGGDQGGPKAEAAEPLLTTPSGLPLRQRRTDPPAAAPSEAPPRPTAPARDPDATRSMMDSYRSGTLRGRSDAVRMSEQDSAPTPSDPQWTDSDSSPPSPESETPQWTQSTPQLRETEEGG